MPETELHSHHPTDRSFPWNSIWDAWRSEYPPPFFRLCLAVLCERWAGYTLLSTAVLMFCEQLGLATPSALRLFGFFSAACYLGSLPGGYLLDRLSVRQQGAVPGASLLLLGYLTLSALHRSALPVGLGLLVFGHSLFRPSAHRRISALFSTQRQGLEGAQIILHFSANLGAAAGSFLAGVLLHLSGWSITYLSAALLMSFATVLCWQDRTKSHSRDPPSEIEHQQPRSQPNLRSSQHLALVAGLSFSMFLFTLCTSQAEGVLLLWTRDRVERVVLGFEVPIAWSVTYAAVLVLVLSPLQWAALPWLRQRVQTPRLVALGLIAAGACFAVLLPTTAWTHRVSLLWILASLTFFVLAELLVAPLGLALLLRSIPHRHSGLVTGLWYAAGALGYVIGGEIGTLWSLWPTSRVLAVLSGLPMLGATVLWFQQEKQ